MRQQGTLWYKLLFPKVHNWIDKITSVCKFTRNLHTPQWTQWGNVSKIHNSTVAHKQAEHTREHTVHMQVFATWNNNNNTHTHTRTHTHTHTHAHTHAHTHTHTSNTGTECIHFAHSKVYSPDSLSVINDIALVQFGWQIAPEKRVKTCEYCYGSCCFWKSETPATVKYWIASLKVLFMTDPMTILNSSKLISHDIKRHLITST